MDEVATSAPTTGQPTPTVAERPVPRDVRHSVDYAAERIAGLMGASEPTDPPSDEQPTPSHEAAPEASEPATQQAEPSTSESPTEANEAPAELPSTLDELAQAFEVPVEKIRDIKVTAKIDGEEVEVTLADAIAGYQRTQDYTRKTTELAEQRTEFERAVQEAEAELQSRVQSLASATQALRQQIIGQEPDWKALLKDPNPRAYQEAKHNWEQRNAAFNRAIQTHQAEAQRTIAQQQQAFQKHLAAEREKMVKNWPELADPEGAAAKEVKTYLREAGFSDQDIGGIVDHRMIAVIKDAIKGRSVSTAAPEKKLVKPKPRATVSPGPASGVVDPRAEKMAAARRNAKRNPKDMKSHADRFRLILGK